jgi:hypothetical protein
MATREYGTDPYGIIARGVPGERSAAPVSFGGVGTPVQSLVNPGQSFGTGVGARFGTSFGPGVAGSGTVDMRKNATPGAVKKAAKGGPVKKMAKGGSVSASKRADGCCTKGKTKGRFV